EYLLGRHIGIFILDCKKNKIEKLNADTFRASYLLPDTSQGLLVAHQYGLWKLGESGIEYYDSSKALLKKRITCMNYFQRKILCLGTRGNGLLLKTRDSIYRIGEEEGLVNNNVKKIITTDEGILVVTNIGLSKITIQSYEPFRYSVINLSYAQGLYVTEVNDVCRLNGILYIASDLG